MTTSKPFQIGPKTVFKVLCNDGVPIHGSKKFRWNLPDGGKPGRMTRSRNRTLGMCRAGLHLTRGAGLAEWFRWSPSFAIFNYHVYVVSEHSEIEHRARGKFVVRSARLERQLPDLTDAENRYCGDKWGRKNWFRRYCDVINRKLRAEWLAEQAAEVRREQALIDQIDHATADDRHTRINQAREALDV